MDSRREFLKKVALLSGTAGIASVLPPSIQKAFSIDPAAGTTFLDAEHVVILMQENRSFDHCYGSLQGVRGFNDPRAYRLPNNNLVWLQSNKKGETFAPFRLNIKDTKSTWMGSLPHGWTDQTDARNEGRYDQWLEVKKSGHEEYENMPLTLGYYTREDIPFYYSLADAFTVCDQNFCSSLTGTTSNRIHLWTGKNREDANAQARVRNEECDFRHEASWITFPERLEDNNISWKIYQNELAVGVGFQGEEDPWLSNFGDNPVEMFTQFNVRFHPAHMKFLPEKVKWLKQEIAKAEEKFKTLKEGTDEYEAYKNGIAEGKREIELTTKDLARYTPKNYLKLSARERSIHEKAFTTNSGDPHYHELIKHRYKDGDTEREMFIPKGDLLYQFRKDVNEGKLPTVSWLVPPENFSDHPDAPWYGSWYLSETMDILTKNPEVWKKTIFILCYDENDGYFDHVPPFTPPLPGKPDSGKTSAGIDVAFEYQSLEGDLKRKPARYARGGPIGLGYRVPLVIASPWSRGGAVCSEVFDHTSILRFLETFLSRKTGKKIEETNISAWRRTVCGNLTSAFIPYNGEKVTLPKFVEKERFVEGIHKAQFKENPSGFTALTQNEIGPTNLRPGPPVLPHQEKGTRLSRALPYELYADGKLTPSGFEIRMEAGNKVFGGSSAGSPFIVYGPGSDFKIRNYAVKAGDSLTDTWSINEFDDGAYNLMLSGPNGFSRSFKGRTEEPHLEIHCAYQMKDNRPTGNLELNITSRSKTGLLLEILDRSYNADMITHNLDAGSTAKLIIDLSNSQQWYDFSMTISEKPGLEYRYSGHVETGEQGISDPAMA